MARTVPNDLLKIFRSSITAVLPENLIRNSVKYNKTTEELTIMQDCYDVRNKKIHLVGTGKAVKNMALETEKLLGSKIYQSIVSIPLGNKDKNAKSEKLNFFEGAKNNLPDNLAESTTKKVIEQITTFNSNDLLLVLISGGGSALLPLAKKPVTLEQKTALIRKLANAGADIKELNIVRKKLSDIKGGKLAIKAQPAQVISLILSDIVGDPIDLIASGPTTENKDSQLDAWNIIQKFNLLHELPEPIKTVLEDTTCNENFPSHNVNNYVIGSNKLSLSAAFNEAKILNYIPIEVSNAVTGNVTDIAQKYCTLSAIVCDLLSGKMGSVDAVAKIDLIGITGIDARKFLNFSVSCDERVCLIFGGEITVEVKGNGVGGRNQHLALEFSRILNENYTKYDGFDIYLLSAGTDGIDGPTDAAGAIGYLDLVNDSKVDNINVHEYIKNNDSYNFYKKFCNGDLHVITGHTNTNVMDIHTIIITKRELNTTL